MSSPVEFRVSLTADNFEKTVSFYRDVLGLPLAHDWSTSQGKCMVFSVERATIEVVDHAQAAYIDGIEVGQRVSGKVRFAFQFSNVQTATNHARTAGARIIHEPVATPWKDINARILGPDGIQVTLFESPSDSK